VAEKKGTDFDKIVYGVALVVALIAGVIAFVSHQEREAEPTEAVEADPVEAAQARADLEEKATGRIEFEAPAKQPQARPLPEGFVPDLPEVPDLETEPPPEREPAEEDPRMQTLAAEMRMLNRARTLLGEHPAEAIGVIDDHRRQYPDGVLREEREAFAIEALLALERVEEAERRYYDFLREFPDSEHREALRRAMQRPPHEVGARGR